MNTKSLLTRIGVPVLSLGLLGGIGATLATSASASTLATTLSAVKSDASRWSPTRPSTGTRPTSTSRPSTRSPGSPAVTVWAYDNLSEQFTGSPS